MEQTNDLETVVDPAAVESKSVDQTPTSSVTWDIPGESEPVTISQEQEAAPQEASNEETPEADSDTQETQESASDAPETAEETPEASEPSLEEVMEEIIDEDTPENVATSIEEATTPEEVSQVPADMPEGIDGLIDFMKETGGTLEDYMNLNKDFSELSELEAVHQYYKDTEPGLSDDEIQLLIEDKFLIETEYEEGKKCLERTSLRR